MKTLFLAFLMTALAPVAAWADDAELARKLDAVAAKQDEILQKLDEVKAELQVVKVRASNK